MTECEWVNAFSFNLKNMMNDALLTQRDLAEMTGLTRETISRCVNGKHVPSLKAIINISYALGCSLDELMDFGEPIRD